MPFSCKKNQEYFSRTILASVLLSSYLSAFAIVVIISSNINMITNHWDFFHFVRLYFEFPIAGYVMRVALCARKIRRWKSPWMRWIQIYTLNITIRTGSFLIQTEKYQTKAEFSWIISQHDQNSNQNLIHIILKSGYHYRNFSRHCKLCINNLSTAAILTEIPIRILEKLWFHLLFRSEFR